MQIGRALKMEGWISRDELMFISGQLLQVKPETVVIFGCYKGRSTTCFVDNSKAKIYSVDPWNGPYYNDDSSLTEYNTAVRDQFEINLAEEIKAERVVPVQQFSYNFIPPAVVDVVFIDADHRYEHIKRDIELAYAMNPRVIAGHDYNWPDWPGVTKAVNEYFPVIEHYFSVWWAYTNEPENINRRSNRGNGTKG